MVKNPPANVGNPRDVGSVPGLGRSPGGGSGNALQYACLGNPMDRGAWWARVQGIAKSWTRLSMPSSVLLLLVVSSIRIRQCLGGTWMWGMALPSGVPHLTGPGSAESRATLRRAPERKPVLSARCHRLGASSNRHSRATVPGLGVQGHSASRLVRERLLFLIGRCHLFAVSLRSRERAFLRLFS